MKKIEISKKLEKAIQEKGVKDPHVMEALIYTVEKQFENTPNEKILKLVWPSSKEWLGALVGAALSGAISPEDLGVGTAAGVYGAKLVNLSWDKMRNFFDAEDAPVKPRWKDQNQPTAAELEQLGEMIQTVTSSANEIWRSHLTEQEQRMEAAAYRIAMRDLRRGGTLSHLAMHLV